jgi:hypothetical protein
VCDDAVRRLRSGGHAACVEAKQAAVTGHPFDGAMTKISDFALEGHVSLIS